MVAGLQSQYLVRRGMKIALNIDYILRCVSLKLREEKVEKIYIDTLTASKCK